VPICSAESAARFNPPAACWTLLARRRTAKESGTNPPDRARSFRPLQIEDNLLSHPDDMKASIACVELCREIGNSAPLRRYTKREVMPGNLKGVDVENFIRQVAATYSHETCTAKMGRFHVRCGWSPQGLWNRKASYR
jgi:choline dehydrogenase